MASVVEAEEDFLVVVVVAAVVLQDIEWCRSMAPLADGGDFGESPLCFSYSFFFLSHLLWRVDVARECALTLVCIKLNYL